MNDQEAGPGKADSAGLALRSPGAIMRQAREAAGMHIGALAVALKVPVRKLEALEADQHDQLPDAVFTRALAASVCKILKTDPAPVLELLPGYVSPLLARSNSAGHGSFNAPGAGWQVPVLSRLSKPVAAIVGLLLLATVVLWLWPTLPGKGPAASLVEPSAPAQTPRAPVIAAFPADPAATPTAPASAPLPLPMPITAAPAPPAADTREVPSAAAAGSVLAIKARSTSWVEVVDAAGVVQLRKNLSNGESAFATGALPLSVVVGRADVTEVSVRGQAFDLAPHAKDNVARFQVK